MDHNRIALMTRTTEQSTKPEESQQTTQNTRETYNLTAEGGPQISSASFGLKDDDGL